jgi:maltooligosyltrehalose trehalohydrolase
MTSRSDLPPGTRAYASSFGATCVDAGHTLPAMGAGEPQRRARAAGRFRGQAPGRTAHRHAAAGDGWFEVVAACGAGALYRYVLDDGFAVPDPASRFQPYDVHGPSQVVDPAAYRWRNDAWRGRPWHETVLYELHVGACGGYANVERRLPALAALGVTAIELMPINAFPGARNWGYDGVLPFAPDASYGRPEELKALIDAAHGSACRCFDVVYNHFGPDGNFLPRYAPEFFRADRKTAWGPAIDFARAEHLLHRQRAVLARRVSLRRAADRRRACDRRRRVAARAGAPRAPMSATRATCIWCWRTSAIPRACWGRTASTRSGTTISTTARTCC